MADGGDTLPAPLLPADIDLTGIPCPIEEIAMAVAPDFGLTAEQALAYVEEMRAEGLIQ